jgi:hypothetical protein
MSEAETGATKLPDPTEKFRELRDAYMEIWSKNLIDTVNSEGYAKASGAALDGYLAVAAPFKEPTEQAMLKTLQQLNMPSSADFAGLAGRFTNIEMQMDDIGAKLDRIEKLLTGTKAAMSEKPRVQTESSAPVRKIAKASPVAKKTAHQKQTALRARGTAKRTTAVKPVRQNPRKGTR